MWKYSLPRVLFYLRLIQLCLHVSGPNNQFYAKLIFLVIIRATNNHIIIVHFYMWQKKLSYWYQSRRDNISDILVIIKNWDDATWRDIPNDLMINFSMLIGYVNNFRSTSMISDQTPLIIANWLISRLLWYLNKILLWVCNIWTIFNESLS